MSDKNKNNSNNNNLQQRFKSMPLLDAIASTGMLYGIKDNNTGKIVVVNPDGKITITSHHRPNAVTKSGKPSNHSIRDNAWDIVPANGWSWNDLYNFLNTDETMGNWFKYRRDARGRQYKVLEEISLELQRRYGATGPNLHIGGDGTVNVGLYTEGRDSKANLSRRAMTKDERNFWLAYDRNWGGTSLDTPEWRNFWGNLVRKESGFNASARNSEDAYGYFLLMPFNRTKSSKYTIDDLFKDAKKVLELNFASFNKNLTSKDAATIALNHWDKYALMRGAWLGGVGNVIKYVRRLANAKDSNGTSVGNYIYGDWANIDYSGTGNLYTDDSSDYSLYAVDNPSNDYSTNYLEPELPLNLIYEIPDLEAPDNQLANNDEEQEQLLLNLSLLQQLAELAEYTKQLQLELEQQLRLLLNINYADNISYSPKQQEISPLEQYVLELMSQPSSEAQQILSSLWSLPREDFTFANNPLLLDKEDLALAYQTALDKMIANGGHLHKEGGDKEIVPTGTIDKLTLRGNNPFNVWRGSQYLTPQYTPGRDYIAYSNGENIWRVPLEKIYPVNDDKLTPQQRLERDWRKSPAYGIDKVILGTLAGTMAPFAIAEAAPALATLVTGASDAAMATRAGQAIYQGLTSPVGKAALSSIFGGMGMHNFFSYNGYKKTLQEWENLLNDPSYYNAVNFGKSALGDAMDVTMMTPLYKPLTYVGKEAWNLGKQGAKWAANTADRAARNMYAPYDYLRTIEETPIKKGSMQQSISREFSVDVPPKQIQFFDQPYKEKVNWDIRDSNGNPTIEKIPATPPEKYGFDVYGTNADAPVVFDASGWPHVDWSTMSGKIMDPIDHNIYLGKIDTFKPESTSLYHWDRGNYPLLYTENGTPYLRRVPYDDGREGLGPIWWEKDRKFGDVDVVNKRLIKVPLDESYTVPNRTGFGNDTTVLTTDYPVGDAEFLQKDDLVGTLARGRFANKPLTAEEPPTLSWEEATAPKITEENAAEFTNNGQFINIDQLENSDVYKGYLEGFKYFNRFSEPQTAYYRNSPVTIVGELSTTPFEEDYVIPYYLRTLEERMPQIKNRYVYQETEDGNFVPRKGLDVIKEEMKKPTSIYLTNADTLNINGFHSSLGSFVGIDLNSLLRDIMSTKIHETIGHGTEDTVEALVGQKVVLEYADLAEDLINSGIKLTSDRSKLWTELRNLILLTRTNLMLKARYKTHNAFLGDFLTSQDVDAFRKSINDINDISEITDVLDYHIPSAYAVDYSNLLKLKPELLPKFKFLLLKGLSVGMPIGAAGALYGVSQEDNNVQAYGGPIIQQANMFGDGGGLLDNLMNTVDTVKQKTQEAVTDTRKQYLDEGYIYKNGKLTKKGRRAVRSQHGITGKLMNKTLDMIDNAERNLMLLNPIKFYDKKSEWFPGYRLVELPWYDDLAITLLDAGSLTGARVSANIFDSLYKAVNYNPLDMDIVENIGAKETTFGNPTDDNSFFKLKTSDKPVIAFLKALNKKYGNKWGNVQHINHGQSLTGSGLLNFGAWPNPWEDAWATASDHDREEDVEKIKQRLIDSYNYTLRMDDYWRNSGEFDKNVIQAAVELYKKGEYNPGLGNYVEYSTKKGNELRNSSTYKKYILPKRSKHSKRVNKDDIWL